MSERNVVVLSRYRLVISVGAVVLALAVGCYASQIGNLRLSSQLVDHMTAMVDIHRRVLVAQNCENDLLRLAYQELGLAFRAQSQGDDWSPNVLKFEELFHQYETARERTERISRELERQVERFSELIEGEGT